MRNERIPYSYHYYTIKCLFAPPKNLGSLFPFARSIQTPLNIIREIHRHFNRHVLRIYTIPMRYIESKLKTITNHLFTPLYECLMCNMTGRLVNVCP